MNTSAVIFLLSLWGVNILGGQQRAQPPKSPSIPTAAPTDKAKPTAQPAQEQARKVSREDVKRDADTIMKNRRIAYLVGVGDYNQTVTGLSSLRYPVPDIMDMAKELGAQGYKVTTQIDRSATAGRIRDDLRELAKLTTKGEGSFLFYYSGHGFAVGKENYLATYGSTAQDLQHQGLAVAELYDLLEATGARQRMAFIDACRNDPDAAKSVGGAGPRTIADFDRAKGTAVLFSTEKGQVSYEDESLGHGIFTYYVLEGLRGGAAGSDGLIAWSDLKKFVEDKMVDRSVAMKKSQVPYQVGEFTGDFLLGKKAPNQVAAVNPLVQVPTLPTPVAPSQRPQVINTTPDAAPIDNQTARNIRAAGSMENVAKAWRSSVDNQLYAIQLDPQNVVIRGLNRNIVADLKFQPTDKKYSYKGQTQLGAARGCPGGQGQIRMRVNAATATRLELEIQIPVNGQHGPLCGYALPGLSPWQKISFIVEN